MLPVAGIEHPNQASEGRAGLFWLGVHSVMERKSWWEGHSRRPLVTLQPQEAEGDKGSLPAFYEFWDPGPENDATSFRMCLLTSVNVIKIVPYSHSERLGS